MEDVVLSCRLLGWQALLQAAHSCAGGNGAKGAISLTIGYGSGASF